MHRQPFGLNSLLVGTDSRNPFGESQTFSLSAISDAFAPSAPPTAKLGEPTMSMDGGVAPGFFRRDNALSILVQGQCSAECGLATISFSTQTAAAEICPYAIIIIIIIIHMPLRYVV